MNITTLYYLIFIGLGALIYYVIPKKIQWIWLLVLSCVFYLKGGYQAVGYILFTAVTIYVGALGIEKYKENAKLKRLIFWLDLLANIGILVAIKGILFVNTCKPDITMFSDFIVPLAVSFYTLQAVSYLLDVYWERQTAEKNPLRLLLFISFFPQMVQGPIARYNDLGKQLTEGHSFDIDEIEKGALVITWGMFKKLVIANRLAPLVGKAFDDAGNYTALFIAVGTVLYAIMQYADFSGGIDIVTGVARIYGIKLAPNFTRPYFSKNLAEFWRRWHISLGNWMKDYVFYPMAISKTMRKTTKWMRKTLGNRWADTFPMVIGNITVFFLVGVWHGFYLHFIIWGLYNGIIIAISSVLEPEYRKIKKAMKISYKTTWYKWFCIIRTFIIVVVGGWFDRAPNFEEGVYITKKILKIPLTFTGSAIPEMLQEFINLDFKGWALGTFIISMLVLFLVELYQEKTGKSFLDKLMLMKLPIRWILLYAFFFLIIIGHVDTADFGAFLYAQF